MEGNGETEFPVKLSLKPMQGGAEEQSRVVEVDDPKMTVLALKRRFFETETAEGRKVRIIHLGRMLGDTMKLGDCKFGKEAILHVVISSLPDQQVDNAGGGVSAGEKRDEATNGVGKTSCSRLSTVLANLLFFAMTGAILYAGAKKVPPFGRLMSSQFLCIAGALWIYLFLCHGLPAIGKALLGRSETAASEPPAGGEGAASTSPLLR